MRNKYYTPTIEEFHVGFEFESNYILFGDTNQWNKVILNDKDHNWFWDSYKEDAVPTEFRVKYLDIEDIESLGWEHIQEIEFTDHTVYQFVREKYILSFEYPKRLICVFQRRDDRTVEHSFISICKNKSELKKLMQQLNIK